jgi:phosphatidylglycerophosphate synthase
MKIFVNIITSLRFLLTLFLPLLKLNVNSTAFIIIIVALFLTDSIDGFLARKFKVQTLFGSIMDTVADKTLTIILLALLVDKMRLLTGVMILEILIAITNCISMGRGNLTKSSYFGKVKMWFLSITIVLSFLYHFKIISILFPTIVGICTSILQIITLINYIRNFKNPVTINNDKIKVKSFKELIHILFDTQYYLKNCAG